MKDILKSFYDKCPVGGTTTAVPDPSQGETLGGFQSVSLAANVMAESGLIHIIELHRESQTGQRLIDAITFVRMK